MLEVIIPGRSDLFDSKRELFMEIKTTKLQLEHSLISLRKWESKWHKPFLNSNLNLEETLDYIKCMTLNSSSVDPMVYFFIPEDVIKTISEYISNPMTATTFSDERAKMGFSGRRGNEIVTAEIIYYWMIALNIPVEFEKWHLRQLLALIKTVSIKNEEADPTKKKRKKDPRVAAMERDRINRERRARHGSKG